MAETPTPESSSTTNGPASTAEDSPTPGRASPRAVLAVVGFGVFIAADGEECAYLPDCAQRTAGIMTTAQELLKEHGLEPQRVRMAAVCSVCAEPFTNYMHEYAAALAGLGPARKAAA